MSVEGLSSTIRALIACMFRGRTGGGVTLWMMALKRAVKAKRLPLLRSLSTQISPPIMRTILRQMASPKPVPPYLRVVDPSAWANASKISPLLLGSMPIPVSSISKRSVAWAFSSSLSIFCRETRMQISPASVNLKALLMRLERTWRRRSGSETSCRGMLGSMSMTNSSCLAMFFSRNMAVLSSMSSWREKGMLSKESLPASILEKSRISLIRARSESEEVRMMRVYSRPRSMWAFFKRRSDIPTMALRGVRISWLMFARNSLLARVD